MLFNAARNIADPEAFKPERWIAESASDRTQKDSNSEAISLAKSVYFPFSLGPRKCIGQRLALLRISVASARIVWLYDMRLAVDQRSVSNDRNDKRKSALHMAAAQQMNESCDRYPNF